VSGPLKKADRTPGPKTEFPTGIILGAGAQTASPSTKPLAQQRDPGLPTPIGSFNFTQLDTSKNLAKSSPF
jgi:hypothetical protein